MQAGPLTPENINLTQKLFVFIFIGLSFWGEPLLVYHNTNKPVVPIKILTGTKKPNQILRKSHFHS